MFEHLSAFQTGKLWLADHTGLAKDALHVYIGLGLFFGSGLLFRWRLHNWRPWLVAAAFAVAGEAWDLRDVIVVNIQPDLWANWHDIWNTMFWPTAIMVLMRYSSLFRNTS